MDTASPVYHAITKRRSEIAGEINHLETQIAKRRGELIHLDAALAIMGYDVPNLKFRAKTTGTAGLFHRGELPRLIVQHLRENADGLQLSEIAQRIASDKAWNTADRRFMVALADKIGKQASKMRKRYGLVCEKVGEGWIWRVSL